MERTYALFPITDQELVKRQVLTWAEPFSICCFLDSQGYPADAFECLLAAGAVDTCTASAGSPFAGPSSIGTASAGPFSTGSPLAGPSSTGSAFAALKTWAKDRQDWLFGHFSYDLAAETEGIDLDAEMKGADLAAASPQPDPTASPQPDLAASPQPRFPDLFFFQPEIIVMVQKDHVRIGSFHADHNAIWEAIRGTRPGGNQLPGPPVFTPRFTREEYLSTVTALQRHILLGHCYEINFCQEFVSRTSRPDPISLWWALSRESPNPFSAYYRQGERYLCCASPERFLRKKGNTLFSQPIKGTARRIPGDPVADRLQSEVLRQSPKDRAENVMVVDVVRNDLSRICVPGSVHVPELFGIYAFPQVFQMISTVAGQLTPGLDWTDAVKAVFPMGSMTGAPKNRVVRLIARYERSPRGLFSGAVGYVDPAGDFDFNVVIRSVLGDRDSGRLSYHVGSGITFYSDPAAEYEECLIKAEGIRKAFAQPPLPQPPFAQPRS